MWIDVVSRLVHSASSVDSRNGTTREIIGYSGVLLAPDRNFLVNKRRALDPCYASAELLWYLSRSNKVDMLLPYAPQYHKFADDGEAYGAYGHRIAFNVDGYDLIWEAIRKLKKHGETRQSIVSLWRPDDLMARKADIPCTICWQLLLRNNALDMVVYMRSNDVWLGMPYDVYCNTCIQTMIADYLDVSVGRYFHFVGSMHLYEKHMKQAEEASMMPASTPRHNWFPGASMLELAPSACAIEASIRLNGKLPYNVDLSTSPIAPDCLSDSVRCCAVKFGAAPVAAIHSPALREGFANADYRRPRPRGKDHASAQGDSNPE